MPPMKPVHKLTGTPKTFEEFSIVETVSWIKYTRADMGGVFALSDVPRNVDAVNIRRCIEMFEALPDTARSDGELVGAVEDLRELLSRLPAERKRA